MYIPYGRQRTLPARSLHLQAIQPAVDSSVFFEMRTEPSDAAACSTVQLLSQLDGILEESKRPDVIFL